MHLTKDQLNFFKQDGFLILNNSKIDLELLNNVRKKFLEIKQNCLDKFYNCYRVYEDYSKKPNIAGIEYIFSEEIINQDIITMFERSNITEVAKQILGDENIILTLDRYHLTSEYSHTGNWHRDGSPNHLESVQLNIYLYDEQGTEIIPYSHLRENTQLEDKIINKSVFSNLADSKAIPCKAGQILAFNPALLHRGKSKDNRVHIHFRFSKTNIIKKNEVRENKLNTKYLENYQMTQSTQKFISEYYAINKKKELYFHNISTKNNILRKIRICIHKMLFFLEPHNPIFGKFNCRPCLKMRKKFLFER